MKYKRYNTKWYFLSRINFMHAIQLDLGLVFQPLPSIVTQNYSLKPYKPGQIVSIPNGIKITNRSGKVTSTHRPNLATVESKAESDGNCYNISYTLRGEKVHTCVISADEIRPTI